MFSWIKKKNGLYSPISGTCKDIEMCSDQIFATKMLGDGYLILPCETTVCSPCVGTVQVIFPTKHAIGIVMDNGQEVLVHIGVDTVKLNGKDFRSFVKTGERVKVGTPLIQFSKMYLASSEIDMSVLVILLNGTTKNYKKERLNEMVHCGDRIIEFGSS